MRTKAILSLGLHILDDIGAGGEVDKRIGTEVVAHLFLLLASINGNDAETHSLCILLSKRTKTTTSTDNGDGLTGLSTGLL